MTMPTFEMPVMVIPSLEPDDRLPQYVRELQGAGFDRIVIIDDGSGPKYQAIFEKLKKLHCDVLYHPVNRGKGAALRTGYLHILKKYPDCSAVMTADSDGQHTVPDCMKVAQALHDGEDALYLGSRDFDLPNVPPKSKKGNKITSRVFQLFYGQYLPDTQTGLRAFRSSELHFMLDVEGDRYEYEMNVLIACARRGLKMIPVTIETVYEDGNAGTHFHPIRDSWRIYKVIFGNFFKYFGSSMFCTLLDQGLAAILREWLLPALGMQSSAAIMWSGYGARLVSSITNFYLNKNLVFKLKNGTGKAAVRYFILVAASITISNLGVMACKGIGIPAWISKFVIDTILYFVNYVFQARWVFAEPVAGDKKGAEK